MASATTSHPSGKPTFGVSAVRCCSLFAVAAASFSFCAAALAQNSGEPASVDEILSSIKRERAGEKQGSAETKKSTPHKRDLPPKQAQAPPQVRTKPLDPNAKIFRPKDRLPGKIAGHYLVGDFYVLGEYIDGGTVIYAVEDEAKTFIRNFVIKDVSSGLAPATYYPEGQRPLVRFTANQPLTFARKLFPGLYEVKARR